MEDKKQDTILGLPVVKVNTYEPVEPITLATLDEVYGAKPSEITPQEAWIESLLRELSTVKAAHIADMERALETIAKLERQADIRKRIDAEKQQLLDDIYEYLKRCADEEFDGERYHPNNEGRLAFRMRDLFGMQD